jgi:probable F420-dependent oxidoreductase
VTSARRITGPAPEETTFVLDFGVTVLPDPPHTRLLELMVLAETHGFDHGWTYDSHVLWQEGMVLLTLMATATERLKLGHCVTNPGTRDPTVVASAYATLQDVTGGRIVCGIGRGDSARRVIGQKPVPIAEFEASLEMMRELMNGRRTRWNEKEIELAWARGLPEIPIYVAAYGPRALGVAGRVGDGVIIQLADPVIVRWIMDQARAAAADAGRDPDSLDFVVCAPSHVSDDLAEARDQVRWFPAMVSNHVLDMIRAHGEEADLPVELTEYVKARTSYDYSEHSRVGARHGEWVTDEICDRFCVIGSSEQVTQKLRELESLGVSQWNIYLMTHGQEQTLESYGREIIPRLRASSAGRTHP